MFSNYDRKTGASFFRNADNTGSAFLSKASIRRMWRDRTRKVCFCRQLLPFRFAHTVLLYRNQVRAFAARRAVGDRPLQPRRTIRVSPGFPTTTERTDSRMENVAGKVFVGCLSYLLPPIQPHHRGQKCRNDISQPFGVSLLRIRSIRFDFEYCIIRLSLFRHTVFRNCFSNRTLANLKSILNLPDTLFL